MKAFSDLPLILPAPVEPDTKHAYHLFTIGVDKNACGLDRDTMLNALNRHRIGAGVYYLAIPEHPFYRERFGWKPEDTPAATAWGRRTLSLPLGPKMSDRDADDVIEAVHEILREKRA